MTDEQPLVSIIIPCRNEEAFIGELLNDLILQDYPSEKMEVLVMDGISTDQTRNIVRKYTEEQPVNIRLIDNPEQFVSPALNTGIRTASGELILRMDAHANYPKNYVSRMVEVLLTENAANAGPLLETLPGNDSTKALAIASAMSSKFGVGDAHFRTGAKEIIEVDTAPFGCFRKTLFDEVGFFDEDLVRNQDDEFNARIRKSGGRVLLVPDCKVSYYARTSYMKLFTMYYQYGLFKPLVNLKLHRITTIRQLIPAGFVLSIFLSLIAAAIYAPLAILYGVIMILYFSVNFYVSSQIASEKKQRITLRLMHAFTTIHVAYGLGYLWGIVEFWILHIHRWKGTKNVKSSR